MGTGIALVIGEFAVVEGIGDAGFRSRLRCRDVAAGPWAVLAASFCCRARHCAWAALAFSGEVSTAMISWSSAMSSSVTCAALSEKPAARTTQAARAGFRRFNIRHLKKRPRVHLGGRRSVCQFLALTTPERLFNESGKEFSTRLRHSEVVKRTKYIRFETLVPDCDTGIRAGLFFHLGDILRTPDLPSTDYARIVEIRKWFNKNLERPERFSSSKSKGAWRRIGKGLSWFKPDANEHLSYARELAAVLRENGYHIEQRESLSPGVIVYQDYFQIVAEPFADRN